MGVILFNHSDTDFTVKKGDRIAQLILERIVIADVSVVPELTETTRGEGGFGSTGVTSSSSSSDTSGSSNVTGSAEKKPRTD